MSDISVCHTVSTSELLRAGSQRSLVEIGGTYSITLTAAVCWVVFDAIHTLSSLSHIVLSTVYS